MQFAFVVDIKLESLVFILIFVDNIFKNKISKIKKGMHKNEIVKYGWIHYVKSPQNYIEFVCPNAAHKLETLSVSLVFITMAV